MGLGMKNVMVPVIDMKKFPIETENMLDACKEWGCFRLINHKISSELMREMKVVSRSLLDLPMEIKERNVNPVGRHGYTAPRQVTPVFEALACHDMAAPHSLPTFYDQLGATPQQRDIISKYSEAIHELSMELARKLAQGLGLDLKENDIFNGWPCLLRINKYNYTPEYIGSTGVYLHTDPGFITIVQDDEAVGGLEILHKETGQYSYVDPMPDSLVVNLGDLAMLWSNGRLWNARHRVQCYEGTARVSIVLFMFGPNDEELFAPEEFIDSEHPRLYKAIKADDYWSLRIANRSATGAVDLLHLKD
ncbi:2-oxoglutarate-dependent dioxygenase DAO-like [Impatiens glandulifera]|uniref:2-oxoglutarate-dependent dioxygenase DAO-like n=1 Tax=Impatiens glandulifera TaxID=253017 RepID=UPI001FB0939E|nr:2-oxoglutarate-dependent dioxygenase DAO-like [Impatiens glandulifera]